MVSESPGRTTVPSAGEVIRRLGWATRSPVKAHDGIKIPTSCVSRRVRSVIMLSPSDGVGKWNEWRILNKGRIQGVNDDGLNRTGAARIKFAWTSKVKILQSRRVDYATDLQRARNAVQLAGERDDSVAGLSGKHIRPT